MHHDAAYYQRPSTLHHLSLLPVPSHCLYLYFKFHLPAPLPHALFATTPAGLLVSLKVPICLPARIYSYQSYVSVQSVILRRHDEAVLHGH